MSEKKNSTDQKNDQPRERRFSRHDSTRSSGDVTFNEDGTPMAPLRMEERSRHRSQASQVSGKSLKSVRTIERAEYHKDLKITLKSSVTRNLVFANFIVMFGCSFLFGYNLGVLNLLKSSICGFFERVLSKRWNCPISNTTTGPLINATVVGNFTTNYNSSSDGSNVMEKCVAPETITILWQLTNAIFIPGGMIGAFSSGFIADKLGRRKSIMLLEIPAFIGAIFSALAESTSTPELLFIGRFITGINCGMATQLAPMYITEVTPFNLRGAFGTGHQLFITLGIFFGALFTLSGTFGTNMLWKYSLLLNIVPAFVCLVVFWLILPDSPRYLLLKHKDRDSAEEALKFFRQMDDVQDDIEEMETESHEKNTTKEKFTMSMLLLSKELRRPLFITLALQMIQQLSGINAVIFYSSTIFLTCGISNAAIQYAVLATNAVNVAMTVVAVRVMDIAGRRRLLLIPMAGMVVILSVLCLSLNLQNEAKWLSYIGAMSVVSYVICFAVGLGPIPMMIGAELFRQGPRPMALSLAGFTNWLFTFIIAMSFESIQSALKEFTFIIFLVLMALFTVFVFFFVPETKNKTFEEIAAQFAPGEGIEVEEWGDAEDADGKVGEDDAFINNGGSGDAKIGIKA